VLNKNKKLCNSIFNTPLKLRNLFIISFFCLFTCSFAQDRDYIVTRSNDTLTAIFRKSKWVDLPMCEVNGVTKKYKPEDLLYYKNGMKHYESAKVAKEKGRRRKWYFLERENNEKDEKLIFYILEYWHTQYPSGTYLYKVQFCKKPGESNENLKGLYDIKSTLEAFSDCPALKEEADTKRIEFVDDAIIFYLDKKKCK
jgi:hypothetical protein